MSLRIGLETHLDYVLKGDKDAWRSYKEHLAHVQVFLRRRKNTRVGFEEGNSYIRLSIPDYVDLNKFFFLFEIGDIFPQTKWRNLIRSSSMLIPHLLHKKAFFLPIYSYSFDRFFTLVYWGEKQFFLNSEQLRRLDIKSLLFTIPRPSNVTISVANLIWFKDVENVRLDDKFLRPSKDYVFNALHPPDLPSSSADKFYVWHEAPFIVVGDRQLEMFTAHKTICYLHLNEVRRSHRENFSETVVHMLDGRLNAREVHCLLPESCLELLKNNPITEAVVIKSIRIYDKESSRRPLFEIILYPFESTSIFGEEDLLGPLITATSIVLRRLYVDSANPLRLQVTLEDVRRRVLNIFRCPPFNRYTLDDLASYLSQRVEGFALALHSLGVYHATENDILYLHPLHLECFSALFGGSDKLFAKIAKDFRSVIPIFLEMLDYVMHHWKEIKEPMYLIKLREFAESKLGVSIDYHSLNQFIASLMMAWEDVIPLSKHISSPASPHPHGGLPLSVDSS